MAEAGLGVVREDIRRTARLVAVAAGVAWLTLFILSFSNRSMGMTYARWAALIVLGIAWGYASTKPAK